MNAFQRVTFWCNEFRPERLSTMAAWNGGNISDLLYQRSVTLDQLRQARAVARPTTAPWYSDGVHTLRTHVAEIAFTSTATAEMLGHVGHALSPQVKEAIDQHVAYEVKLPWRSALLSAQTAMSNRDLASTAAAGFVTQVNADINHYGPLVGTMDLDVEVADVIQTQFLADTIDGIRAEHPTFLLRINIAPFKGGLLPVDKIVGDQNIVVYEQTYFGDMSPVREADCIFDIPQAIRDTGRWGLCVGAATEQVPWPSGPRIPALGSVRYHGTLSGRKLGGGVEVFSDDLEAQVGWI